MLYNTRNCYKLLHKKQKIELPPEIFMKLNAYLLKHKYHPQLSEFTASLHLIIVISQ